MNVSVLDIFKRSGDAHIGQTLTRLAELAQAAHEYEMAMHDIDADAAELLIGAAAERSVAVDEREAAR